MKSNNRRKNYRLDEHAKKRRPRLTLIGIGSSGRKDVAERSEDYLLERSPKFWAMIRRARRGKSVALDEVRRQLGLSKK
jgi:hypothetical protein